MVVIFNQLEIIDNTRDAQKILSEVEIAEFEAKMGIKFPCGYKELFQPFGTGMFGDWVVIACPHPRIRFHSVDCAEPAIENMKIAVKIPPAT